MVIEFAEGGGLDTALKKNFKRSWTWHEPLLKISIDIANALLFMHHTPFYDDTTKTVQNTILHRDMKPSNVLLTSCLTAKLADFGTSKAVDRSAVQTIVGTPIFMAPEVHKGDSYSHSADVFSFGMTLWAISVGHESLFKRVIKAMRSKDRPTANHEAITKTMNAIAKDNLRPSLDERVQADMPPSLKRLISSCWDSNKISRPTMEEVVKELKGPVTEELSKQFQRNARFKVERDAAPILKGAAERSARRCTIEQKRN